MFLFIPVWLLMVVALSGVMVYYIQAELKCADIDDTEGSGVVNCLPYLDTSEWVGHTHAHAHTRTHTHTHTHTHIRTHMHSIGPFRS